MAEEIQIVEVSRIQASPYQPRVNFDEAALDELAASIRQHGVIQPILVRPVAGSRFELIAGERRLRAVQRLGLRTITAMVRNYSEEEALETALIENLQRENLGIVEEARAYRRLEAEFGYTQAEIALRTGKSRPAINNTLRLLQLPEEVLELLERGELSEGQARALLGLPYPSLQTEVAEWAVRNAVPVRELERKVRELSTRPGASAEGAGPAAEAGMARPASGNVHVSALEERLRRHYGSKVVVGYRKGRGTVTIEFYSDDDLYRLLELMGVQE